MISFSAYKYELEQLDEGVHDPAIFKAIFLAGGPGSGKSFMVGKTALPALGLKLVNSDPAFESALAKAGLTTKSEDIYSPQGQKIRIKAKALVGKQQQLYINGRLGLTIDGTGKNLGKIKKQNEGLGKLGYETGMIYVNTDLETALKRNRNRERVLPDDVVEDMWKEVQKNLGAFQRMFKTKMFIIDNSEGSKYERDVQSVYKKVMSWTRKKPDTPAASAWLKLQK